MTDTRDIVERIAPLLEELETGQDCAEYAYAKGKGFQAMTYCPEAFEALKELPEYIASLRKQLEDAREVALEQAARVAEEAPITGPTLSSWINANESPMGATRRHIATAIRALKGKS